MQTSLDWKRPLDIHALCESSACLEGKVQVPREGELYDLLLDSFEVEAHMMFLKNEKKQPYIQLSMKGMVPVQCQKCLGPFSILLERSWVLGVLFPKKIYTQDLFPSDWEPLFLAQKMIHLQTLLQEELILSLPVVPRHLENECSLPEELRKEI